MKSITFNKVPINWVLGTWGGAVLLCIPVALYLPYTPNDFLLKSQVIAYVIFPVCIMVFLYKLSNYVRSPKTVTFDSLSCEVVKDSKVGANVKLFLLLENRGFFALNVVYHGGETEKFDTFYKMDLESELENEIQGTDKIKLVRIN